MSCCPDCGRHLFASETGCPACRAAAVDAAAESDAADALDENRRVAVARFQNGAEAGYFADELTRTSGMATEVLARERFDAVHAAWSIDYVLLVDREQAADAASRLELLVETTSDEADSGVDESRLWNDIPCSVWIPLFVTLAAGSIACFGIERVERPVRPPALVVRDPREPPNLWHILGASRGPWRQQLDDGAGVRTLSINAETGTAILREDHDGDGQADQEWRFDSTR